MDDAQQIFDYLPISFRSPTEQEYVKFLWDTFLTNYEAKKYPFAFLAYHMLFMCFVYFEIWQIRQNHEGDFEKAMIGFGNEIETNLIKATTPFSLWKINERSVFRLLKLIGMENSDIGQCTRIVDDRNDTAHSNGNIFFNDQVAMDKKIRDILRYAEKIQCYSEKVVLNCFERFLLESIDPETREYIDESDQVREVLVHNNYLSPRDILIVKNYNTMKFSEREYYTNILTLVKGLCDLYPENG